jgi:hypothetical protein
MWISRFILKAKNSLDEDTKLFQFKTEKLYSMIQELCHFKEVHDEFKTKAHYTNTLEGYLIFILPTHFVFFDRTF